MSNRLIKPLPESRTILPVVAPPIFKEFIFKDWRVAVAPESERPLPVVVAEMVAVGVPAAMPVTANSADEVAVDPRRKSCVVILSKIAPLPSSNGEPPLRTGNIPVTSVAFERFTSEEVRTPLPSE